MTDEAKALAEWLDKTAWVQDTSQTHELGLHRADVLRNWIEELLSWKAAEEAHHHQLNHLIETQAREIERLRLDVEAQEALQVSAYHAGLRAGWNFGVSDDNAGMQAAMANTDHIKELHRIREARAALAGDSNDQ